MMSRRARWIIRSLAMLFTLAGAGFVVWESVDYRGGGWLESAVAYFVLDLAFAAFVWLATSEMR